MGKLHDDYSLLINQLEAYLSAADKENAEQARNKILGSNGLPGLIAALEEKGPWVKIDALKKLESEVTSAGKRLAEVEDIKSETSNHKRILDEVKGKISEGTKKAEQLAVNVGALETTIKSLSQTAKESEGELKKEIVLSRGETNRQMEEIKSTARKTSEQTDARLETLSYEIDLLKSELAKSQNVVNQLRSHVCQLMNMTKKTSMLSRLGVGKKEWATLSESLGPNIPPVVDNGFSTTKAEGQADEDIDSCGGQDEPVQSNKNPIKTDDGKNHRQLATQQTTNDVHKKEKVKKENNNKKWNPFRKKKRK